MKTVFFKRTSTVFSLTACAVAGSGLSVLAQTSELHPPEEITALSSENLAQTSKIALAETKTDSAQEKFKELQLNSVVKLPKSQAEKTLSSSPLQTPEMTAANKNEFSSVQIESENSFKLEPATPLSIPISQKTEPQAKMRLVKPEPTPITAIDSINTSPINDPNVLTSASGLTKKPTPVQNSETVAESPQPEAVAQDVRPGRNTRSGPSYLGIGVNVGIGDNALGGGAFTILGKVGLTPNLSVRPAVLIGEDLAFLVPLTYDFVPREAAEIEDRTISFAPYVGGGFAISTGDDGGLGLLISGGVDVPLSSTFTATAGLNLAFIDDPSVGILIGVGYTFPQIER